MKRIVLVCLGLIFVFVLTGCNKNVDSKSRGEVKVTEVEWNDQGVGNEETFSIDVQKGDVLSDSSFGTLTVKKVTDDYVLISVSEGFVEKEGKGINMNADDLTKIKLKKGESITIASKTFDAGITITIEY